MTEERDLDAWVGSLGIEQVRSELAARQLNTDGILPTLRQRLMKYEMELQDKESLTPTPLATAVEFFSQTGVPHVLGGATGAEAPGGTVREELKELRVPRSTRLVRQGAQTTGPRTASSGPAGSENLYNLLRKWNLRYSGEGTSEDVEDFLGEIAIHRTMVPVADRELLQCLPLFLSGTARLWFIDRHTRWSTWREFEVAFRNRFAAPGYQAALRQEVERRTQGEGERAADYITRLKAMLDRLDPPWSVSQQLDLARRNLLPRVRAFIRRDDYYDYDSLEEAAIRAEAEVQADREYRPPPPPERTLIPRLAYHPPRGVSRVHSAAAFGGSSGNRSQGRGRESEVGLPTPRERERREVAPRGRTADSVTTATVVEGAASVSREEGPVRGGAGGPRCWNCSGQGHLAKNCSQPARLHCYRCGRQGYAVRDCPTCSGNGTESR